MYIRNLPPPPPEKQSWNALFIGRFGRRELLRISPLQLTKTNVYCASRVIVFNASIIYFHALFLSPIPEVTVLLSHCRNQPSPTPPFAVMPFASSQHSPIPDYRSSFYRCQPRCVYSKNTTTSGDRL